MAPKAGRDDHPRRRDEPRDHKPSRNDRERSRSPIRETRRDDRRRDRSPPARNGATTNAPSRRDDRDYEHSRRRDRQPSNSPPPHSSRRQNEPNSRAPRQAPASRSTATHGANPVPMDINDEEDSADAMQRLMGFAAFRTTKETKVPGNDRNYAVHKTKKTEYRQYMNRVGGFNRALSPSR